jgi:hypothetical protein
MIYLMTVFLKPIFSVFMETMLVLTKLSEFMNLCCLQVLTMLSVFMKPMQATSTYHFFCIYETHAGYKYLPCCLYLWYPIQATSNYHVVCIYETHAVLFILSVFMKPHTGYKYSPCCLFLWSPYRLKILTVLSVFVESHTGYKYWLCGLYLWNP